MENWALIKISVLKHPDSRHSNIEFAARNAANDFFNIKKIYIIFYWIDIIEYQIIDPY